LGRYHISSRFFIASIYIASIYIASIFIASIFITSIFITSIYIASIYEFTGSSSTPPDTFRIYLTRTSNGANLS